jgi:asparagine synthase (glutamine-hydrolysing)
MKRIIGCSVHHGSGEPALRDGDQSRIDGPILQRRGTQAVALRGRPRVDGELFDEASIGGKILALYAEHGAHFLTRLRGPFALAILDENSDNALLAIDRIGAEKLCWGVRDRLAFGTSAAEVANMLAATRQVNPQALFDFMLGHMVAAPDTVFAGVNKLPPGSFLQYENGQVRLQRYWEPKFEHAPQSAVDSLRRQLLPTLRQAVRACEPDVGSGAFLSGGLDSSTVTGLLAEEMGQETPAFSVGFGVDQYDELAFARIAIKRFGCKHHEYEVVPRDIVELIPRIAAAYDEPFGNSSAVPTFCCARFAKEHGVDHLLAGDGGDELFGGNERYVRHRIFELYARLPKWLRATLAEPLAARLDPESSPLPLRKFSSYVRQARVPLPERYESWNLIYREGPANVFDPDFLKSVDTDYPLQKMREVWEACPSDDLLDKMLWYDWKFTLADNDLRKVTEMCELAGVRVSYPMLDEDLIDLSLQVPSSAKIANGKLRTFFKEGVRDFLPTEIINKEKHGFGLPFGLWLKSDKALQELVYGSLDTLKVRGILDRSFVERVTDEHRLGHASYYGYAIWDLVMLEQWLQQHVDRQTT